jgi:hypothetical protein
MIKIIFLDIRIQIIYNVCVYKILCICMRGFSEAKSGANKPATNFGLVKTSNFLYTA